MADTPASRFTVNAVEAAAIAGVTAQTISRWQRQRLISALRVGPGKFWFDPDEIRALIVEYPRAAVKDAVTETVATAPEFSDEQAETIRQLLQSGAGGA